MVDDLNATASQQTVVNGLLSLPWALKIGAFYCRTIAGYLTNLSPLSHLFTYLTWVSYHCHSLSTVGCGFLSDSRPIMGLRRKPYFMIGWGTYVLCNFVLAAIRTPDITSLALFIFLMTMGFVQADVCTDAMIVERSQLYETNETRGTLQATGYIIRFFGGIVGALLGALVYNKAIWGWGLPIWVIFLMNGLIPLATVVPFLPCLVEVPTEAPPTIAHQVSVILKMLPPPPPPS